MNKYNRRGYINNVNIDISLIEDSKTMQLISKQYEFDLRLIFYEFLQRNTACYS